jgi:hypothetical protein
MVRNLRWSWIALMVWAGAVMDGRAVGAGQGEDKEPAPAVTDAAAACPDCVPEGAGPDLFYNFYVPPGCGGVGGQLYIAPRPVPAFVGHTYVTYQPLMPHELLYTHYHSYYRYYDCGRGMTRVKTVYYYPPIRTWVGQTVHHFRIPR